MRSKDEATIAEENGIMRTRTAGGASLAVALAIAASGCGGSSDDTTGVASVPGSGRDAAATSTTGTTAESPQDRMVDFARCMRQHGVDMPDPQPDANGNFGIRVGGPGKGGGPSSQPTQKMQKAMQACRPKLGGGQQTISPADRQRAQDAALSFARCMRQHGVDVPDPKIKGGLIQMFGPRTA